MADTVVNRTIHESKKRLVVRSEIQSDGVGSTDAILVDKSTFTGPNGLEPTKFLVQRIDWACDGMQVILEFDHTADDLLVSCDGNTSNSGFFDFTNGGQFQGFVDPASAGATGDIVGTTVGHSAGDKAVFVFYLVKKD